MRKTNKFDIFLTVFLLFALFAVGLHIGTDKSGDEIGELAILLYVTGAKRVRAGDGLLIDGNIPARLISFDGSYAIITVSAEPLEAGFLAGGRKYIAKNQPIRSVSKSGSLDGRIIAIEASTFR